MPPLENSRTVTGPHWPVRKYGPADNTQHSQQVDIHDPGGIQTRNTCKRAIAEPRLGPRDHWDRRYYENSRKNKHSPNEMPFMYNMF
jgi:hypothetical protein